MLRRFEVVLTVLCLAGFCAGVASATSYTLTDLGDLGGNNVNFVSGLATVGGNTVVVGTASVSSNNTAWYWESGTMNSLASTLTTLCSSTGHGTYSSSIATGVNAAGQLIGYYVNTGGTDYGFAYNLGSSTANNILGSCTSYGNSTNNSVNSSGQLFGLYASLGDNSYICNANGTTNAVQINGSTNYTQLGGINDSGWVTGKNTDSYIYNNGASSSTWTWTDLGHLSTFGSSGYGIDAAGDVVGLSGVAGGSATKGHAFYVPYTGSGTWGSMVDLGDMTGDGSAYSGYTYGQANAINNGQIVGYYFNSTKSVTSEYAFLSGTTNGSIVPLQNDVPAFATSNFSRLSMADDINRAGAIVGLGVTNGGAVDAFLVTPITTPEPSTLLLAASGLFGLLAYAWRKRK